MSGIDIDKLTELLLQQREELIGQKKAGQASTRTVELDQSTVGRLSRMDAMQSQAMALEGKRRREIQLTRIEAALERIEEGEFGYCAMCDEEIAGRRLEIDPANPFCVHCAEKI